MAQQRVGPRDRHGHQLVRFVRGVAEHHALVASALVKRGLAVHALGDVGRLAMKLAHVGECVPGEPFVRTIVTDVLDDVAGDLADVDLVESAAGDFAGVHHEIGRDHRFAGDVRAGIAFEAGVQNRVGNLVRDFVGMAFRDRLGSEHVPRGIFLHLRLLSSFSKRIRDNP